MLVMGVAPILAPVGKAVGSASALMGDTAICRGRNHGHTGRVAAQRHGHSHGGDYHGVQHHGILIAAGFDEARPLLTPQNNWHAIRAHALQRVGIITTG
jgi:hypothetical protein